MQRCLAEIFLPAQYLGQLLMCRCERGRLLYGGAQAIRRAALVAQMPQRDRQCVVQRRLKINQRQRFDGAIGCLCMPPRGQMDPSFERYCLPILAIRATSAADEFEGAIMVAQRGVTFRQGFFFWSRCTYPHQHRELAFETTI